MKKVLKRGLIIVGIYAIFTTYLFFASNRIERLNDNDDTEKVNVTIKYSE
ncbi:MAG: hypothetical protein IJI22_00280 [Bacilli bacterium]|nr:hypothetical protein [Bacilli bacterium]